MDIYLPEVKKAIEFNGKYWHSSKIMKKRDAYKQVLCDENDIRLLSVSEFDWIDNKDVCLKNIEKFILED